MIEPQAINMKRHLVYPLDFDSRAHLLQEPGPNWEEAPKRLHLENREKLIQSLKIELGENNFEEKIKNFRDAGMAPFSIVSYHNGLYHQARYAFIQGLYYPSLTAACALGERILNHLILDLRDYYKGSPHYKNVYRKDSFDDWDEAIDILKDWSVFQTSDVETQFRKLKKLRHQSIHFNIQTYISLRDDALLAIRYLCEIISQQFGFARKQKWMIRGTAGAFFVKSESENDPFMKTYYLSQCPKVGPYYSMTLGKEGWLFVDWNNYENKNITDEEFATLHKSRKPEQLISTSPIPNEAIIQTIKYRN